MVYQTATKEDLKLLDLMKLQVIAPMTSLISSQLVRLCRLEIDDLTFMELYICTSTSLPHSYLLFKGVGSLGLI